MNTLILYEDDHLLVVNKPSGVNTHRPDRYALEGLHEWLAGRHTRWARLAILHRLDKETSGVMVFGKTRQANQSLTRQFTAHEVRKSYLLLSDRPPTRVRCQARSKGAVTEFERLEEHRGYSLVVARPVTGKTHQIRRHAAESGFPILGDVEYDGPPAPRLMLHAHRLEFRHPETGQTVRFEASVPAAFEEIDALVVAREFRELLFDEQTNAYRLIHGAADGFPGVVVDSYAGRLLVQWRRHPDSGQRVEFLANLRRRCAPLAIYEQVATRRDRLAPVAVTLPGDAPEPATSTERFLIRENGVAYRVSFGEGLGTGIFVDQRENRRRLLHLDLAGQQVLNCFSYTCAFSVAAARAGAVVTSVDLSRRYLDWARENFHANDLDADRHDFIYGDVFDWLGRFHKRDRRWDLVILDPPTFSTTKRGRVFRATRDYEELLQLALPVLTAPGQLLCCSNQQTLTPEQLATAIKEAAARCGRTVTALEFVTQPFDCRPAAGEHPYLKSFWVDCQ